MYCTGEPFVRRKLPNQVYSCTGSSLNRIVNIIIVRNRVTKLRPPGRRWLETGTGATCLCTLQRNHTYNFLEIYNLCMVSRILHPMTPSHLAIFK